MSQYIGTSRERSVYHTAQICENGHIILDGIEGCKELMAPFCKKCGKPTITQCEKCSSNIRGRYGDSLSISKIEFPLFCYKCGDRYPWTAAKLNAAMELADELGELTIEEREKLKQSLPDLMIEGVKTDLAVTRVKKILTGVSGLGKETILKIVVGIATEAVKKTLGL